MPSGRYSREPITLSFPPFTRAISWLVGITVGMYLLLELLQLSPGTAGLARSLYALLGLTPTLVMHGAVWQLVTFDFVHTSFIPLLIYMLMLWMFGAQLEQVWGARRFLGLYFSSSVGGALIFIAVAYAGALNINPGMTVMGAAAGLYGVYMAFGMVFAESELMMFPLPISIKAKYFVWILIVVTLAFSLSQGAAGMETPLLGALFIGYLYTRMSQRMPARAYAGAYRSGRGYAPPPEPKHMGLMARWRDNYYKWKRRRAARKFEVYMRKHNRDVFFDEHGNYIEPDARQDHENGEGKTPWVN